MVTKSHLCIIFIAYIIVKGNCMNKKQKISVITAVVIVLLTIIIWQIYGGEIFTKSQVLVEKKDPLFGFTDKQWVDKFIWGLDLSLLISGISVFIAGVLFFVFRDKKSKTNGTNSSKELS